MREIAEELGAASRIVGFAGVVEHAYTDRGNAPSSQAARGRSGTAGRPTNSAGSERHAARSVC
ncbi:hypothetical protein [Nocardia anaemiae]|uniref:hypothetical protein n=1 Tax=Nocardia anaemiae TaxID=263910 RepID=UPI003530D27F